MAQFNSLTDKVRQMLGGMPQTLSDIGNRVGSNISLMGKIPQAAQQFVQQPDKFNQTLSQNIKRPGLGAPLTVPSFIASNTIKATGSLLQKGIPSALKIGSYISPGLSAARMSGVYPQLNAPVKGSDVLNIAGLAGIPKVGANIIGGGIGTTFKVGENALMRKPLDQGLGEAYRQGYQFSAQLAPVEKLTSWIASPTIKALSNKFPVFNKVVNKLTPGEVKDFTTWVTESLKQGNKSGLAMSVFGALQDSKNGQETLKNIWDQYRMGFVFGAGGKAVGNLKPGVIDPLREKLKPMTLDQKVANQGGFVKLAPGEKPTLEQLKADIANQAKNKPNGFNPIEDIPGTRPGLRAEFDNAIARQDVETIQKLLPEVPEAYKKQVGKYLDPILNSPLRQEAKKYKSAEEFVNEKINVFHATTDAQAKSIEQLGYKPSLGRGFSNQPGEFAYFTPSVNGALRYSKTSSNGLNRITSGYLDGKILQIDSELPDFEAIAQAQKKLGVPLLPNAKGELTMLDIEGLKNAMKDKGYAAIEFKDRYSNGAVAIAAIPESVKTKSQLTDIWNQANKGVENPITKLESQLHPDDVKTLKVDKEIEGWSDKQYKSILEDKIQELNDFAGGQMSKDASYVDLQSSINELRKTAKEIGKPELAKMVELEANKISDPEQARKYIMNGLRGIRDQRFANKAKSAPKGFNPMEDLPGTRPGLRAEFDNAINRKDVAIIQKLLPEVPDTYKKQVGKYLDPILNTSQPKTVRTIKVAGQSRTQQPISSPASGNVGTVAGASGGQTSQPILETAPLNKSIPQRGFAESVQTNKKTPAEIKPELEKIRYEPISNAETMAQADKIIQTDELKALDFAKNNTDTTANSVSLKLIEKYLDQGRFSEANDLISAVAPRFTKAGQEIQILSTYGRLTPTGAIKYAQTLINQANKANPKLNLKLTEANTKIITEYANRVQSLPVGSRERIVATAQLMQKITDQVPPSIGQKIATIQTMMQLLNPKTAIRNIIGNTLFTGAENISDVFATGLDRITSIITGRRSKVLPSITAQGKGFIKGGKEGLEDAMLGIDTSGGVSSQFEIKGKTFTDPIFGSLEKALNIELRVPDRAAYTAAFEGSLNNQMRAAGVAKATSEMIEIAHADGLYRTFQDNSRLAQIFSGVKKTLNKIGTPDGKFGLGDFIIKYPKTPANILSRGLDYSPAGFVKGIYEGIRPFMTGQPFNQKQFVENLSRAMVGTGLISAGYILAKNGIISGKNDKDYDISSVKRTTGQGAFKLNVSALARFFQSGGQKQDDQNGDTLVSYDWAQPTSIQVAMGANSALGGNAEDMASIASDNLQAGVDTLTGQSMVKNLMDYAGGIKDKGFVGATQDMALNSATGFIPSVVRQTANVFDPLQRSTYAETPAGVAINKAKATIPFVRNTLEPKLDVFGKEMPNYEGSGLRRLFDIFVNPAFVTKIQENPAAKEVIDIYQRSGLTTQAPRVADSKIKINGQDVKVSPRQYTEYQRYIGTKTDETFNALMNDPLFRKSSDEEKAKLLQGILTDINSAAKIELFGNNPKSIPQDVKNIIKSSTNATDRMLTLTKEGNLKMAMGDIEYPKLTGNTELDKKLISSYQGKLTQKANEVVAMFEAGEITAAQAESELSKIIELKNKASTKKAKKAPKITVRKLSAPKIAKSARIKIKIPKLKKPKTLKLKKYTVKLSK